MAKKYIEIRLKIRSGHGYPSLKDVLKWGEPFGEVYEVALQTDTTWTLMDEELIQKIKDRAESAK